MNRLAITRVNLKAKDPRSHLAYIMLDEKRDFVEFSVFEETDSILGNIYVGRVDNIVPGISGAFVRISPKQVCFLHLEDVVSPIYTRKLSKKADLCMGYELLVQVTKDAIKTKEPVVSTKLTLNGRYSLLTTDNCSFGVSKKIGKERSEEIKGILDEYEVLSQEQAFGLLVRTNGAFVSDVALKEDLQELVNHFLAIKESSKHQCAFALLEKQEEPYIKQLKSADLARLDGVYTDDEEIFHKIEASLPYIKEKGLLHLYQDDKVSLSTLYNFRGSLDQLVEKKVWLKSGANIIIEQLETMTVIDINSGKNISNKEDVVLGINKEAAVEIARQLRLRNISGMIIIDFINMKSKESMQDLVTFLKQEIKKDSVTCSFIDVTRLGLVELTRKKTHRSLKEIL